MKTIDLSKSKWVKRFTYKKVVLFKKWVPENTRFQVVKFARNTSIKPHYHLKTVEIYIVLSGKGDLGINGLWYPLNKNRMYLIEPNDIHEIVTKTGIKIAIFKPFEAKGDILWIKKA